MNNLLIIGARGLGREIYNMLPDCKGYGEKFCVKGFLDDNVDALNGKDGYPPIVDSVENYEPHTDDVFICALGDAHWKKYYVDLVLSKGGRFINIIHNTSKIERNTTIGIGCVVKEHVIISCDISIGNFVTFQEFATIGHDATIQDFAHLGVRSFMGGYSQIGKATTLHTNSIVLPHIKVGDDCIVGAGAVVMRKVANKTTVYGNPAKKL